MSEDLTNEKSTLDQVMACHQATSHKFAKPDLTQICVAIVSLGHNELITFWGLVMHLSYDLYCKIDEIHKLFTWKTLLMWLIHLFSNSKIDKWVLQDYSSSLGTFFLWTTVHQNSDMHICLLCFCPNPFTTSSRTVIHNSHGVALSGALPLWACFALPEVVDPGLILATSRPAGFGSNINYWSEFWGRWNEIEASASVWDLSWTVTLKLWLAVDEINQLDFDVMFFGKNDGNEVMSCLGWII